MCPQGSEPSDPELESAPAEVIVRFNGSSHRLKYHPGDTLLETMRRAGLPAPSVCEQGVCGTCMARLLQGEVALRENHVLSDEDLALGYTLACQGVPCSAVCEIAIGE
jgi:3-ketosteroid 9alpha-monooxygenase subunit B